MWNEDDNKEQTDNGSLHAEMNIQKVELIRTLTVVGSVPLMAYPSKAVETMRVYQKNGRLYR